jgi:hypothetical protein
MGSDPIYGTRFDHRALDNRGMPDEDGDCTCLSSSPLLGGGIQLSPCRAATVHDGIRTERVTPTGHLLNAWWPLLEVHEPIANAPLVEPGSCSFHGVAVHDAVELDQDRPHRATA